MSDFKPIQTVYKGYRFRSRSEARWAIFFDTLGINYVYEPEGFKLSSGDMYLPDFWLPDCQTFFEVKGIMKDKDEAKIERLMADSGRPVVVGYSDFTFRAPDFWGEDGGYGFASEKEDSILFKCPNCGNFCFIGITGGWDCPACGYYGKLYHFSHMCGTGPDRYTSEDALCAVEAARRARFEHGEDPTPWRKP